LATDDGHQTGDVGFAARGDDVVAVGSLPTSNGRGMRDDGSSRRPAAPSLLQLTYIDADPGSLRRFGWRGALLPLER
jgi:hypothetical protein